jgi:tripartite-type tricarboxylate transporter receptor subunit TctC
VKRIAATCLIGFVAAIAAYPSAAQTPFPARAVRIVVPFPGGGINDVLARIIGDKLQARWGQPVVIENKTGAGGNIGADLAYQAEPDGYTLLLSPPGPLAINQSLYKQLSYKPQELVPLTLVGSVPNVVIVRKNLPVSSLGELVDYVKASPGKVSFGSQGNGATPHLTGMMFQGMTGTEMVHVPYRGENLVLNDMIGGHVDVFFGNVAAARPQFRDGKVKVLAVLMPSALRRCPRFRPPRRPACRGSCPPAGLRWRRRRGPQWPCSRRSPRRWWRSSICPTCKQNSGPPASSPHPARLPRWLPSSRRRLGDGARSSRRTTSL